MNETSAKDTDCDSIVAATSATTSAACESIMNETSAKDKDSYLTVAVASTNCDFVSRMNRVSAKGNGKAKSKAKPEETEAPEDFLQSSQSDVELMDHLVPHYAFVVSEKILRMPWMAPYDAYVAEQKKIFQIDQLEDFAKAREFKDEQLVELFYKYRFYHYDREYSDETYSVKQSWTSFVKAITANPERWWEKYNELKSKFYNTTKMGSMMMTHLYSLVDIKFCCVPKAFDCPLCDPETPRFQRKPKVGYDSHKWYERMMLLNDQQRGKPLTRQEKEDIKFELWVGDFEPKDRGFCPPIPTPSKDFECETEPTSSVSGDLEDPLNAAQIEKLREEVQYVSRKDDINHTMSTTQFIDLRRELSSLKEQVSELFSLKEQVSELFSLKEQVSELPFLKEQVSELKRARYS